MIIVGTCEGYYLFPSVHYVNSSANGRCDITSPKQQSRSKGQRITAHAKTTQPMQ